MTDSVSNNVTAKALNHVASGGSDLEASPGFYTEGLGTPETKAFRADPANKS